MRKLLAGMMPVVCAALLLSACGGCSGPAPAAEFVQQAARLHDEALADAVTSDADLRDYVQQVGHRLIEAGQEIAANKTRDPLFAGMQFHLVNSEVVNAFTTGGSHVYVYEPLFRLCESEEELAAAMAHEYAHAINLDVERTGMKPDPKAPLPLLAYHFVNYRFTAIQEEQADDLAFRLYVGGGWSPDKFALLWQRLAAISPGAVAPDRAPLSVRVERLQSLARSEDSQRRRRLPVADRRTFAALHAQAVRGESPLPPTAPAALFLRAFPNCLLGGDTPEEQEAQKRLKPPPPSATPLEPS